MPHPTGQGRLSKADNTLTIRQVLAFAAACWIAGCILYMIRLGNPEILGSLLCCGLPGLLVAALTKMGMDQLRH